MQSSPSRRALCSAVALAVLVPCALPALRAQQPPPSVARSGSTTVVGLETDAAAEPLGIDDRAPRLSWQLESAQRAVLQASYRVLVATRPELLSGGRADVWDSGETPSGEPWVIYRGKPLASRTRYFWTVRVRTTAGVATAWSR